MIGDDTEGIYSLEIQRVALEDDAVFQCQVGAAAGSPGIRSRDARLTVLVPPEPPRIVQGDQLSTTAGAVVRLQCESRGGKPPAEIEWYSGDRELMESSSRTEVSVLPDGKRSLVSSTLTLTAAARHHDTTVTCRAHNSALSAPQTAALRLRVRFAPQVTLRAGAPRVVERQDLTFTCSATANPEQVKYQWFVNEEEQAGHNGAQLVLRSVGRALNNATVRCRAENEVGPGSDVQRVSVLYAPRFRQEPQDVAADAGHEVSLRCDVDANPRPRVTWVKRDCQSCQRRVGVGPRLRLRATRETVGRYECHASAEGFPAVSRQLTLFVRARPEVTARARQQGVAGETVHVECVVASVPPPHTTTWYFQHEQLSPELSGYKVIEEPVVGGVRSLLVIPRALDKDFGLYNCSFENAYGSDSAAIILQKQRALPLLVILIFVIGGIVVIAAITLVIILCQRRYRRASDKPSEQARRDKLRHQTDGSSSDSDLKEEMGVIITDRWQAGHDVITDRWQGDGEAAAGRGGEDAAGLLDGPHFAKETATFGDLAGYPCYDQHGYAQPPSRAARGLYTGSQ
ncbi:irregular chiasm C-roughest protein-like [Pollicipes pollicipes]|uniref:irregular chiasm C-roughest protein-like n=1 Tax=Pollicipes pollicipes TaxID=41117 RepID=UPI0018851BF2|nr:irregular chiasm C-roughest protein-like [Pollicipes pollicipes]